MDRRLELQAILENIDGGNIDPNLKVDTFFQPPDNVKLTYPCIVYERSRASTEFANNKPYRYTKRYTITYISRSPTSETPDRLAALPMCVHSTFFVADNLNHDVFDMYF